MKTQNKQFAIRATTIAVQGALAVMASMPLAATADDEITALTRPDNYAELGGIQVNHGSAKFGEYNGMNEGHGYVIGNVGVRGGSGYDGSGTMTYDVFGTDLGTTSRAFGANVSSQGDWNLRFNFDQLKHYQTDSYQMPYQQSPGSNQFTLSPSFGYVNTSVLTPIPANQRVAGSTAASTWAAGNRNLTAAQIGQFQTVEIASERKNTSLGGDFTIDRQWSISVDANHLDQSGSKLQSLPTQSYSLVRVPNASSGTFTWKNQGAITAPMPTNSTTDTVNVGLNWRGDSGFATVGYFGSFYRNDNNSYSVDSPMVTSSTTSATVSGAGFGYAANTMSLPPDNSLHQFLANGGYNFSRTTKLVGGFSYGRNTQNQSFVSDPLGLAPNSSLDGEVITTNANARLTDTSFKDLTLSGGFKYNERDNQTQSNLYRFFNITQIPTAAQFASGDTTSRVVNTPYSNRKTQIDLAGDYRLTNTQNLRFSYEYEDVKRWCNDVAAGAAGSGAGSNAGSGAPAGAQCVSGPSSSENRFNVLFRQRIGGVVNYYIGYTYADRNADYDPSFYTPYAINGGEYLGFRPFFEASRTQNVFKANVSWEATDQLNLSLNGRYGKDKYADSQFGDQDGKNWNINADATYRYAEEGSASIYAGYQYRDRNENLANNGSKSPLVAGTTTNQYVYGQKDESSSIGMNFKHTGLFGSKFDLAGDLAYYHDLTKQNTAWNYSVPPAATASCNLSNVNSCGDYPNVTNNLWQFKLLGSYNVDKTGKVNLYYVYQKLDSTDYYYNGYASGYTAAAQQPTNEQAPSYSVQAIGASYVVKF